MWFRGVLGGEVSGVVHLHVHPTPLTGRRARGARVLTIIIFLRRPKPWRGRRARRRARPRPPRASALATSRRWSGSWMSRAYFPIRVTPPYESVDKSNIFYMNRLTSRAPATAPSGHGGGPQCQWPVRSARSSHGQGDPVYVETDFLKRTQGYAQHDRAAPERQVRTSGGR